MSQTTTQFFIDFIQEYGSAWNNYDVDKIISSYHTPCFIFKTGKLFTNLTEEAKKNYFYNLLVDYRRQGYARAEIPQCDVKMLGKNSALVSVNWVCKKDDGTVVFDFWDSYHIVNMDGFWKILDDTVHDE